MKIIIKLLCVRVCAIACVVVVVVVSVIMSNALCAAENEASVSDKKEPKNEAQVQHEQRAAALADNLIKEIEEQRLGPDVETIKLVAAIDLLARKAEAYVLVEQPLDASRLLEQVQLAIGQLSKEQLARAKKQITGVEQRMYVVAQVIFEHSKTMKLDSKEDQPNSSARAEGTEGVKDIEQAEQSVQADQPDVTEEKDASKE